MVGSGPEVVGEVAHKLAMELAVLHGKVVENGTVFRAPRDFEISSESLGGKEASNGVGQGQIMQQQQGQQTSQGGGQRGVRAMSLPPVLPDHNSVEESHLEPMQIEKPKQLDDSRRMDRDLGGGLPQYQPYWYPSPPKNTPHLTTPCVSLESL
jgi:hypothetical protein